MPEPRAWLPLSSSPHDCKQSDAACALRYAEHLKDRIHHESGAIYHMLVESQYDLWTTMDHKHFACSSLGYTDEDGPSTLLRVIWSSKQLQGPYRGFGFKAPGACAAAGGATCHSSHHCPMFPMSLPKGA